MFAKPNQDIDVPILFTGNDVSGGFLSGIAGLDLTVTLPPGLGWRNDLGMYDPNPHGTHTALAARRATWPFINHSLYFGETSICLLAAPTADAMTAARAGAPLRFAFVNGGSGWGWGEPDGHLITLRLKTSANFTPSTPPNIQLSIGPVVDSYGNYFVNAYIGTSPLYGDVNSDGVINSADVTMLKFYIASSDRPKFRADNRTFNFENARVAGGSDVTAADVSLLQLWIATPVNERGSVKLGP
jgi:hypothetical protein